MLAHVHAAWPEAAQERTAPYRHVPQISSPAKVRVQRMQRPLPAWVPLAGKAGLDVRIREWGASQLRQPGEELLALRRCESEIVVACLGRFAAMEADGLIQSRRLAAMEVAALAVHGIEVHQRRGAPFAGRGKTVTDPAGILGAEIVQQQVSVDEQELLTARVRHIRMVAGGAAALSQQRLYRRIGRIFRRLERAH